MARTVTLKGNPLNLAGQEIKVGDKAPDAQLRKDLLNNIRLSETKGVRVLSVVPSLDTPVCAEQTRKFHQELSKLPDVHLYTISADLPTAQKRFCSAEQLEGERCATLSDHKDADFGTKYGTLIPDLRIDCRAVFVVDKNNVVRYAEYVPEISQHPNYDAVLAATRDAARS